jgi:pimeloyl-ACP methyl ester carboxylesterase
MTMLRLFLIALSLAALPAHAQGVTERSASVNGVRINYKIAGSGPVVILLHGYTQTSHMWLPLIPRLSGSHTVIAPDLRGIGASERTAGGYDKKTMAKDIRELVRGLGHKEKVQVVGHDIGLMVAYAYAAQYSDEVGKIVLMDAFLPGIGDWTHVWLLRDLWHFHFYGETPLALVKGRERIYFEHFWNDFAADRAKSIPEADRQLYAAAYARADGMRAGFEYFKSFEQDARDFGGFSKTKLPMPMLVLTGEKASGNFLIDQARVVASNVEGVVVPGSGHWLMEEAPQQVMPRIVAFLHASASQSAAAHGPPALQRLTPAEIEARESAGPGAGTSGVAGIQTIVLSGNPTQPGLYTILLKAPANTRIEAHTHPDDRVATVISGTWYFGYGDRFDEGLLKALPPGSFYTEPSNESHFARTGDMPVVVHISGSGPTGTRYPQRTGDRAEVQ